MIKIQVRGIEELQNFLKELPRGTKRAAIEAAAEYLIGNDSHGLKHLAKYKYVSRKAAYGVTFFTDRQRRWFFWAMRSGKINPGSGYRSGATSEGWQYKLTNNGYAAQLRNATQGAKYVQGDDTQARQPAKVGHRKVSAVISTNIQGAMRASSQAVERWIKKNEPK